jgi:hypothetical protein
MTTTDTQPTTPFQAPRELAEAEARDRDKTVRIGDLWRSTPVLLLWVRHFG